MFKIDCRLSLFAKTVARRVGEVTSIQKGMWIIIPQFLVQFKCLCAAQATFVWTSATVTRTILWLLSVYSKSSYLAIHGGFLDHTQNHLRSCINSSGKTVLWAAPYFRDFLSLTTIKCSTFHWLNYSEFMTNIESKLDSLLNIVISTFLSEIPQYSSTHTQKRELKSMILTFFAISGLNSTAARSPPWCFQARPVSERTLTRRCSVLRATKAQDS